MDVVVDEGLWRSEAKAKAQSSSKRDEIALGDRALERKGNQRCLSMKILESLRWKFCTA